MAILHRCFWLSVLLSIGCTLQAQTANRPPIQVDEAKLKFHLQPETSLEFPLYNGSDTPLNFTLLVEMLGWDNKVVASRHRLFSLAPGTLMTDKIIWDAKQLADALPLSDGRLRYTITSDDGKFSPIHGVVQLAVITEDAFDMRTFGGGLGTCSRDCTFWVRVDNTHTGEPFAGVNVTAEVRIGKGSIKEEAVTDENGYAKIHFELPDPKVVSGEFLYFNLTAHRGPFHVGFGTPNFWWSHPPRLTLTTDKPIYQPGQTVHMRMLARGIDKRAWEKANVTVKITDRTGQEHFHTTALTSKFGVATADWEVPEKLNLGDYAIEAVIDPNHSRTSAKANVRVSRYDLPEFIVTATPDRTYYVPGEDAASIQVQAEYLFGKPVQKATVRVVEAYGWAWMYQLQKPPANLPSLAEGELDASGKFVAQLNLKPKFSYLETSKLPFTDWPIAVYLTDASTGRTEQRRLDLRISLQPIHLYLYETFGISSSEPAEFHITSFYADGTPASVNGVIEAARLNAGGEFDEHPDSAHRTPLGTFHTNNLGVARVEVTPLKSLDAYPPENTGLYAWYGHSQLNGEPSPPMANKRVSILFSGRDDHGLTGAAQQTVLLSRSVDYIQVRTDHTLYHPGDPIHLKIVTNSGLAEALVNIRDEDGRLLASQPAHINDQHGEVTVPYAAGFHGTLKIFVYDITDANTPRPILTGGATILYPAGQSLQVAMSMPRTTFRPGEAASAAFRVTTSNGEPVESDLGVLVFDRAVAERVRTDQQFGRRYGFYLDDYFCCDARFIRSESQQRRVGEITISHLLAIDPRKPFPEGLDLVAEVLLNTYPYRSEQEFWGFNMNLRSNRTSPSLDQIQTALDKIYTASGRYPTNESEYRAELKETGVDPDSMLDAWEMPYRPVFADREGNLLLMLVSNGPDKRAGTRDDFVARYFQWPYYKKIGQEIDKAIAAYHSTTHKYIADYETLRAEVRKANLDLDALHDPWGNRYRYKFHIENNQLKLEVDSPGPDGRFSTPQDYSNDDVHEWTSSIQIFREEQAAIEAALDQYYAQTGKFPHSNEDLKPVLDLAKLSPDRLLDPFGKPYQVTFGSYNRYSDRVEMRTYSEYGGPVRKKTEITPVTQQMVLIQVLTTSTNFYNVVSSFNRAIAEQSSKDVKPVALPQELPRSGETGGIAGTVTSGTGESVASATVVATATSTGRQVTTRTDQQGAYSFSALPVGIYVLDFTANGFRAAQVTKVPVQQGKTTKLDTQLESLSTGEVANGDRALGFGANSGSTVEVVSGGADLLQLEGQKNNDQSIRALEHEEKPLSTPRVRQYFPETLLWRPEVITDAQGNAHIQFPMGDNITAWKMSVVASNLAGQVGVAEKELRTFQPFMIEDDPPKVLTQGDRISLPLVIRNYSDHAQSVTAELRPESWLSLISAPRQQVSVPAQGDATPVFAFMARSPVQRGIHHVTARNHETGDAVEQKVSVHPDGEQISESVARLLSGKDDMLEISVPENAIAGSADTEVRIYPNITAHVLDAVHAVEPTYEWCTEGLASRGYNNLLVLQLLKKAGQDNADPGNPNAGLAAAARKAVQDAYNGLQAWQRSDGSYGYCFAYPRRTDIAPTAYAMRFLNSASAFIEVDRKFIDNAARYLARQQKSSGAWLAYDWVQKKEVEDANVTALTARALAEAAASSKGPEREEIQKPLPQAMRYLEDRIGSWQDAYLVGNYAIAAANSGREEHIQQAKELLDSLAHTEGATTYWNLEANTSPFCNWGRSARLETTALAVEALSLFQGKDSKPDTATELNRGLQFLLSHKDHRGAWYGSVVTQDVIAAMVAAMPSAPEADVASEATIVINGHTVSTIKLPRGSAVVGPSVVELAQYLQRGINRVQIRRSSNASLMNAAAFTSYYIPWKDSSSTQEENFKSGESRALKLSAHYDQSSPLAGQVVRCEVIAERLGFRGYGVMIAEIGLPPGAEVDREFLQGTWPVLSYEVHPDRVRFYLWPIPGGTKFAFQFRMRYAMEAAATPSILYDYYNPESRATVQPVHFSVHEAGEKLTPATEARSH